MTAPPPPSSLDRPVRALPVIAVTVLLGASSAVLLISKFAPPEERTVPMVRRGDEPAAVHDDEHYVAGTPPAVCERWLRAWMRGRYEEARELSVGELRAKAEANLAKVGGFNTDEMEQFRQTRVYVDAAHFDLEHAQIQELPPSAAGRPRKQVVGQAHATGAYDGVRIDSRRGQTFVLELVDGAWRVADRTWETFEDSRMETANSGATASPADGGHP